MSPGKTLAKVHTEMHGEVGMLCTHTGKVGSVQPGKGPGGAVEEEEESGRPQGAGKADGCWRCSSPGEGARGRPTRG